MVTNFLHSTSEGCDSGNEDDLDFDKLDLYACSCRYRLARCGSANRLLGTCC
jgi:hypothetical protein